LRSRRERFSRCIVRIREDSEKSLVPGRKLILENSGNTNRKTEWTLAAARHEGRWVPLISTRSSKLAAETVINDFHPGYSVETEKRLGDSRIDLRLSGTSETIWVEVKACTLVEHGRALFPDSPSLRARRHLSELASVNAPDRGEVLFTVMNPDVEYFSPNPHTDPEFCIDLASAEQRGVAIRCVSFRCERDGSCRPVNSSVPVDLSSVEMASLDSGVLIRVSDSGDEDGYWSVEFETHADGLLKAERRREIKRSTVMLAIRGEMSAFAGLEQDLSTFLNQIGIRAFRTPENPLINPSFMNLILEYRHRRVFNP
jgi:sugar fermentation stimulation protein A